MSKSAAPPGGRLNPNAISVADAAAALTSVSGLKVDAAFLEADIKEGAPTNPDGTLNLVTYGAWLVREARRAG